MKRRGFMLLELMIAFAIVGMVVLSVVGMMGEGPWILRRCQEREQALDLLELQLHRMEQDPQTYSQEQLEDQSVNGTTYTVRALMSDTEEETLRQVAVRWKSRNVPQVLERSCRAPKDP